MKNLRCLHVRVGLALSAVVLVVVVSGCDLAKNQLAYDRTADADRQEYRDAMAPRPLPPEDNTSIPDFASVMATPEDLRLPSPLVSVSVNQTVSLRDLLFELTDQAGVDVEIDPQIRGSIIFTAKERPFDEVVDRIAKMAGLKYNFDNNILRMELDRPYVKTYKIDYTNVERKSESSISTKISVVDAEQGSAGSSANVENKFESDFWGEIESNIEQILTSSDTFTSLATLADPVAMPVSNLPPAGDPSTNPPGLPGEAAAVAPTLNVSVPVAEPAIPNPPSTFSISKQTGMLSVFATERQQKMVTKFLNEFHHLALSQIQIEAKVLQVELSDEYSSGIVWEKVNLSGLITLSTSGLTSPAGSTVAARLNGGNDIQAAVSALSTFGTVRALSSPRVTVLNNQPAVLNVVQNNVFFEFDVQTEKDTDTNVTTITIDSTTKSVPEGVLLTVIPTANPDTGEIVMVVRPTVSNIVRLIPDPTIGLTLAVSVTDPDILDSLGEIVNNIPELGVQEVDSVVSVQSGQILVMGGLMKDENNVTEVSVPVLGDIPLVGSLFRSHTDTVSKTELVVFIKATIIPGSNVDEVDRDLYSRFGQDRRPARM